MRKGVTLPEPPFDTPEAVRDETKPTARTVRVDDDVDPDDVLRNLPRARWNPASSGTRQVRRK